MTKWNKVPTLCKLTTLDRIAKWAERQNALEGEEARYRSTQASWLEGERPVASLRRSGPDGFSSQKVQGLWAWEQYTGWDCLRYLPIRPEDLKDAEKRQVIESRFRMWPRTFIRPCPIRPVHGYIESRPILLNELDLFVEECQSKDPDVEFILCQWIPATWNAVLSPGRLVVGPGHDGATSGKGAVELPLRSALSWPSGVLTAAGVPKVEAPYLELVGTDSVLYATQLRAGPPLPVVQDYVPADMKVARIVEPWGEDLLEWAERVKSMEPGTVVYHAGGSLASHYGVHCVLHKVPYMVTRCPKVGEWLEQPDEGHKEPDFEAVLSGIRASGHLAARLKWDRIEFPVLPLILAALHESPWLTQTRQGCYWLGAGLDLAARCAMMAVLGERRHRGKGRRGVPRSVIYAEAWDQPKRFLVQLAHSKRAFGARGWPHGFGGTAWANCAAHTARLVSMLRLFAHDPTTKHWTSVMEALNLVVTAAHNNGAFLSKFANGPEGNSIFDHAAAGSVRFYTHLAQAVGSVALRQAGSMAEQSVWEVAGPPSKKPKRIKARKLGPDYSVQVIFRDEDHTAHFQVRGPTDMGSHVVVNKPVSELPEGFVEWAQAQPTRESFASTGTQYYIMLVTEQGNIVGPNGEEFAL